MGKRIIAVLLLYCVASSGVVALGRSSLSSSSSLTPSSRLTARKTTDQSYDPYMVCDLEGPTYAEGLPSAYNHQVFAELLTLCSSAHGARQNVGCFCVRARGPVHCDQGLAEQGLWQAQYRPQDEAIIHRFIVDGVLPHTEEEISFPDLCRYGCECKRPDDALDWYRQTFEGEDYEVLSGVDGLIPQNSASADTRGGGPPATFGAGTVAAGGVVQQQPAKHDIQWQNQCGNNCTSAKDCGVPEGGSSACTCQAHSSQYQPGSGTVAFIAACLVTLGSGSGGKRGLNQGLPCPCNSTYVSHGCCGVLDGLVWESPESNLGKLLDSD